MHTITSSSSSLEHNVLRHCDAFFMVVHPPLPSSPDAQALHFILMHSVLHWSPTDSSSFLKHNESRYSDGIAMIYYGLVIILTIHLLVLCWSTICQGIVCWMTFVGQCFSLDVTIVTTWPSMFAVLIFIWAAWCLMHGVTYYLDLYELSIYCSVAYQSGVKCCFWLKFECFCMIT